MERHSGGDADFWRGRRPCLRLAEGRRRESVRAFHDAKPEWLGGFGLSLRRVWSTLFAEAAPGQQGAFSLTDSAGSGVGSEKALSFLRRLRRDSGLRLGSRARSLLLRTLRGCRKSAPVCTRKRAAALALGRASYARPRSDSSRGFGKSLRQETAWTPHEIAPPSCDGGAMN